MYVVRWIYIFIYKKEDSRQKKAREREREKETIVFNKSKKNIDIILSFLQKWTCHDIPWRKDRDTVLVPIEWLGYHTGLIILCSKQKSLQ